MTETAIVLIIIAGAGAYLARRAWTAAARVRRAKNTQGCASSCCSPE